MSMHKEDYAAKGKEWFGNFMEDWKENSLVLLGGIVIGWILKSIF